MTINIHTIEFDEINQRYLDEEGIVLAETPEAVTRVARALRNAVNNGNMSIEL